MPAIPKLILPAVSTLLLTLTGAPPVLAQIVTTGDAKIPLVYKTENTGAKFAKPTFPSFDKLPIIRPLPDPFVMANGKRDTTFANWEQRRNQIKAAIEKYEIGPKPDCFDCKITANYVPAADANSKGTLTINVTRNGKTITLTEPVFIPTGQGNGPYAAVIAMSGGARPVRPGAPAAAPAPATGNFGSLPRGVFSNLPVATVDFVHNQVTVYGAKGQVHTSDPFYTLYPDLCAGTCPNGASNSGMYAAWSWGVSRVIDGIEIASKQAQNPLPIDPQRLAVTGCSYAGKMALFAGAFDERIALTIAQENGGGGAPAWRVSHEIAPQGSVEKIDTTNTEWFGQQMWQFAGDNVYKLPEDHDELMDLVAPRALLETGNTDYNWLSNPANYVSARATQQVYNTFGIGDRFGFFIDGKHPHCGTLPVEAPVVASFVDKFLLGKASTATDVEVNPFPTLDYKRWTAWWGTHPKGEPQFPTPWVGAKNTFVVPLTSASLKLEPGQTIDAAYQLMIPGNHPEATVNVVGGATVQADVDCADGTSYTTRIPLTANQTYTIPANGNAWVPDGAAKQVDTTTAAPASKIPVPSTAACATHAVIRDAYLSVLGVSPKNAEPGGPGITTTDTADPLDVRFTCSANGVSSAPTAAININPQP
jgi:hypothetical protein